MPHAKSHLPTKICVSCGLPFTWRKKWRHCWQELRFCSKRCRQPAMRRAKAASGSVRARFMAGDV